MEQLTKFSSVAHWLPRLGLAGVFLYHGITKFPVAPGYADSLGYPVFAIYLLALAETTGGILILIGGFGPDWATRIAGLFFSVVMLGAIFLVHIQHGWNSINTGSGNMGRGMEFQFLLLMVSLFFLINGNYANNVYKRKEE